MFICTLADSAEVTELHGNGEFIYSMPVGYDDQTHNVFSALVIFSPLAGYGDGTGYELVFRLVETSIVTDQDVVYWDGLHTKRFLSNRDDRSAVLKAIGAVIASHVDRHRPYAVDMVTFVDDLPAKALEKYNWIASLFAYNGYNLGPADPYHGRWIWMMRLS